MPVIGIPLRYNVLKDERPILLLGEIVRRTIQKAGGFVYPICPVQDVNYYETRYNDFKDLTDEEKQIIQRSLDLCDGILFPGGLKMTPYDRYLLEEAIKRDLPILGICLGMQIMSCYKEDINLKKIESTINHKQENDDEFTHIVKIKKGSKLYDIVGKEELLVNSFHNYCGTENNEYTASAISEDGIIEGIELESSTYNIGVQWHPEISYDFDESSKKIIDSFINAAKTFKNKEKSQKNVDK